jgi:hypothetical protein
LSTRFPTSAPTNAAAVAAIKTNAFSATDADAIQPK